MRARRELMEILNTVNIDDLEEEIQVMNERGAMIKKGSDMNPGEVDKMVNLLQEYVVIQRACNVLKKEMTSVEEQKAKYKKLYETAENKAKADKYMNKYLEMANEYKALKDEFGYYRELLNKRDEDAIKYDRKLNAMIDEIRARDKKQIKGKN